MCGICLIVLEITAVKWEIYDNFLSAEGVEKELFIEK
jgi:hypothetical protein